MTMTPIFSIGLRKFLEKSFLASGNKRQRVINTSPLMTSEHPDVAALREAAGIMGIGFENAGYSADLALGTNGRIGFYGPEIGLSEGAVMLRWGSAEAPVELDKLDLDVTEDGDIIVLYKGYSGLHLRLKKAADGKRPKASFVLAKAASGKLSEALGELGSGGGGRLLSTNALEPGDYSVVGVGYRDFNDGKPPVRYVELKTGQLIRCNYALNEELNLSDEPTPDKPCTLTILPWTGATTDKGHRITSIRYMPYAAMEFGDFDAGFDMSLPEPDTAPDDEASYAAFA